MKKRVLLNRGKKVIVFVAGFILSCLLVPIMANYADRLRGYNGTGGEIFIPLLYLVVIAFIKSFSDIKKESTSNGAN